MTTLVGLHAVTLLLFLSSSFSSRQPPRGAGYKFRARVVCLWHGRDQVQLGGFVSVISHVMARELFNFFVGALDYGSVLVCLIAGCRKSCGLRRGCALGSGVLGAGYLASPGPSLGAKSRFFASSLFCGFPRFLSWDFFFRVVSVAMRFWASLPREVIVQLCHLCVHDVGSRFTTISISRISMELSLFWDSASAAAVAVFMATSMFTGFGLLSGVPLVVLVQLQLARRL